MKGAVKMLDKLIKRIVSAAIESFPIDEARKEKLKNNIIKVKGEADKNAL